MALRARLRPEGVATGAVDVELPVELVPPPMLKTWISARPADPVEELTEVTEKRSEVVLTGVTRSTVVAEPPLASEGTETEVPSLKVRVPPVIWSSKLGLS